MITLIPEQSHLSPVLSANDTCHYVCIGKTTLYHLINKGEFAKRIRLGANKIGFLRVDLDAWLEGRKF